MSSATADPAAPAPQDNNGAAATTSKTELVISDLQDSSGVSLIKPPPHAEPESIGLNSKLAVVLKNVKDAPDASRFVLFLNGQPITDMGDTYYDAKLHALVFHLQRTSQNATEWVAILGSPRELTRKVSVALGTQPQNGGTATPDITGDPGKPRPEFSFVVLAPWRLVVSFAAVAIMLVFVWGSAKKTAIIKDNQIPQISPEQQTYSLGRWQMAIWFSLIFTSYVFLYILLNDVNTLNSQALLLMGISSATALAAISVDAAKDTPSDAVNQALKLIGIKSYEDVKRIRYEIDSRQEELTVKGIDPARVAKLSGEIADRQNVLATYNDNIAPFVTQGWFKDLATDQNGYALHRLQVVSWTLLLGAIFLYGVYSELTMPQFSATLLAVMGISGAGYVGFKFPEAQQ